ncbi:hypothetical protein INT43_008209 [Umbelopsis isabellina]|uniref:NodB homology domain-containing protein n=1 Tax=Mortierella isabellina TaxID=91625 RepID=A0A8H7PDS9_MORIS|nr:hypothetical protein INT43_008209 [Umbelopsis isabellina]
MFIKRTLTLSAVIAMVSAQSSPVASASGAVGSGSPTTDGLLAQTSPAYLATITPLAGNVNAAPAPGAAIPTGALGNVTIDTSVYPAVWEVPPTNSSEVQAAIAAIDWTKVPNATVHTADNNGDLSFTGYDANTDPYCWWSDTNCVKPKVDYLPPDIYNCPNPGDWGLTYDDGPLNPANPPAPDQWAEPNLYNFLAAANQKATLFYIGSNVLTFPQAAQRALADGLTICVHTWSHPPMTTMTNDQAVAQFYWTLRAIKEVIGITPKCWRPPYGDVDDRIRSIAWQMGMRTIIWDEDTNDWNMPGEGGGNLPPATVDGYFQGWIDARKNGSDTASGHVVLEHELNNATVSMAEKWLPQIKQVFNVVPVHECQNISQPYWESNFVYPTEDNSSSTTSSSLSLAPSAQSTGGSSSSSSSSAEASAAAASQASGAGKIVAGVFSAAGVVTGLLLNL